MLDVDRLAKAIRAYLGPQLSPETRGMPTWYIDIDSSVSDEEILALAQDLWWRYETTPIREEPES